MTSPVSGTRVERMLVRTMWGLRKGGPGHTYAGERNNVFGIANYEIEPAKENE